MSVVFLLLLNYGDSVLSQEVLRFLVLGQEADIHPAMSAELKEIQGLKEPWKLDAIK